MEGSTRAPEGPIAASNEMKEANHERALNPTGGTPMPRSIGKPLGINETHPNPFQIAPVGGGAPGVWEMAPSFWGLVPTSCGSAPTIRGGAPQTWGMPPTSWGLAPTIWELAPPSWGIAPTFWGGGAENGGLAPTFWGLPPGIG